MTQGLLSTDLKILRKLKQMSVGLSTYLADEYLRRVKSIDPITNRPRADVINPNSGWVDNDLPRDEWATTEIRENTVSYAIGDPIGRLVTGSNGKTITFTEYADAERARQGARVEFNVDVDVPAANKVLGPTAK
jgi:hypothetical protein